MARERKFSTDELYRAVKQLLLEHGYDNFTISLLAEQLDVSRGTIYKYFENKEELLTEFMVREMDLFLLELKKVEAKRGFVAQFDYILELVFENTDFHQILSMASLIPAHLTKKALSNKKRLEQQHFEMYRLLADVIRLGKEEKKLKEHLPDSVILGFIFQVIAIPNYFGVPKPQWVASIKEILMHGMFEQDN